MRRHLRARYLGGKFPGREIANCGRGETTGLLLTIIQSRLAVGADEVRSEEEAWVLGEIEEEACLAGLDRMQQNPGEGTGLALEIGIFGISPPQEKSFFQAFTESGGEEETTNSREPSDMGFILPRVLTEYP